jgi:hypothetical protein
VNEILLRPEVSFSRLHRGVAEQHLNLLQLTAGSATALGARAAEIMWREARNTNFRRILPEHLPDYFLAQRALEDTVTA